MSETYDDLFQDNPPTAEKLQEAIDALGVNVPVLKARVVGSRVELSLYGGQVLYHPSVKVEIKSSRPDGQFIPTPPAQKMTSNQHIIAFPNRYDRKLLRQVGEQLGIEGARTMNKVPLVQAIRAWREETGWDPDQDTAS